MALISASDLFGKDFFKFIPITSLRYPSKVKRVKFKKSDKAYNNQTVRYKIK